MLRIRLRRTGRKKQPSYRVVVIEGENPRGGMYLDSIGIYNPRTKPAELRIDMQKVDHWLERGATMSETVESLVRRARKGGDKTVKIVSAPAAVGAAESERAE